MPTPGVILRRFALWTLVCVVSAAPSFAVAYNQFHTGAMVLAVALFIVGYTALTSTAAFERFHRRPFMRRTLYIGYGARMALSIAFPIGVRADLFPGLISVGFVENVLKLEPQSFAGTFATTCVQGAILNTILVIFMAVVQGLQRLFCESPPREVRGFAVIMPGSQADSGRA